MYLKKGRLSPRLISTNRGFRSMKEELKDLLELLDIEQIEANMFRGVSPAEGWQRV